MAKACCRRQYNSKKIHYLVKRIAHQICKQTVPNNESSSANGKLICTNCNKFVAFKGQQTEFQHFCDAQFLIEWLESNSKSSGTGEVLIELFPKSKKRNCNVSHWFSSKCLDLTRQWCIRFPNNKHTIDLQQYCSRSGQKSGRLCLRRRTLRSPQTKRRHLMNLQF